MKIKKMLSVLLTMLLILCLAACGKNEEASGDNSNEKIIVNFYEHSDNEDILNDQVEAYNAQSEDVEVKLHIIANDEYDDKIKVMLSGNADVLLAAWWRSSETVGGKRCAASA